MGSRVVARRLLPSLPSLILGNQALRRAAAPRLLKEVAQVSAADPGQPHQNRGVAAVVIGSEERLRICLHAEVAFVVATLHHQCLAVLPQPSEEPAADSKPRGSVARAFLDAWKRAEESAHRLQGQWRSLGHRISPYPGIPMNAA